MGGLCAVVEPVPGFDEVVEGVAVVPLAVLLAQQFGPSILRLREHIRQALVDGATRLIARSDHWRCGITT